MQYIQQNWDQIALIITSVVAAASAIAALTPTPKDDTWVARAYKLSDGLAINVGQAKDKGAMDEE